MCYLLFFPCCFSYLFSVFDLVNLINVCLGMLCLGFILFGTLWVSWTWVIISFPILGKRPTSKQETHRVPNRINPRQNTARHILIKLTKIKHKEQILKAAREKQQGVLFLYPFSQSLSFGWGIQPIYI